MKQRHRIFFRASGLLVAALVLAGCMYDAALHRLTLAEQSQFYTYSKLMTPSQKRAYLAKSTLPEREAYLSEIALKQRFQSLEPTDRDTVLGGLPRLGMSAEALRFLWGEPYTTDGDAKRYAYWHYLGSSAELGIKGNQYGSAGSQVEVHIVAGKVVGWVDEIPSDDNSGSDSDRTRN